MADNPKDVVVIGGGPAGTTAATLLAQQGHDVAVFEREWFPRVHVGESLIPACNAVLAKTGVLERLDATGSPRKHGVQFLTKTSAGRPFYFTEVDDPLMHHSWQVRRSTFDQLLLSRAAEAGVETVTKTQVVGVTEQDGAVVGVTVRPEGGRERHVPARAVVDASGSLGLLARRRGGRARIRGLENTACWAHYRGVRLDPGVDAGSTLIFRLDATAWIWWIPLPDVVSLGLVAPAKRISSFGDDPTEILENAIASCPTLVERMGHAERCSEVRAVRDFSYRAARDGGRGWLLAGDALGFIDPIYSTGLFLSLYSADLAAQAIDRALQEPGVPDFTGFATDYQVAFDRFLVLVRAYYADDFHFREFAQSEERRQGLVDLLTGLVHTEAAREVSHALRAWYDEVAAQAV